jgi:hypothetical protein
MSAYLSMHSDVFRYTDIHTTHIYAGRLQERR